MAKPKRKILPKDFEALLTAGDLEALKAVFAGCDVDARGGVLKQTALAFVDCPNARSRWLVKQGADLAAGDAYGETPLHARAGHWKGDVALLIELGADVNHDAGGRSTPLHRAAAAGIFERPGCCWIMEPGSTRSTARARRRLALPFNAAAMRRSRAWRRWQSG